MLKLYPRYDNDTAPHSQTIIDDSMFFLGKGILKNKCIITHKKLSTTNFVTTHALESDTPVGAMYLPDPRENKSLITPRTTIVKATRLS